MRIVFVGGGTGGHFYPLIAVAESLVERAKQDRLVMPDLYFMGPDPYDAGSLFALGITYTHCPAGKLRRYFSLRNISDTFKTIAGFFVALYKLYVLYPDVVMSKGGYTSVPVVLAAWLLKIPIVVHESDSIPGRSNILAGKLAQYVAISYKEAGSYFADEKTALTGIPMRLELLEKAPERPHDTLSIAPQRPLILIIGGSQGAERINDLILSSLEDLLKEYEILHQAGREHASTVENTARALVGDSDLLAHYHVVGFMDAATLHAGYSAASLVVSRAGSTSIHEISAHGKPSILIPLPESISRDQRSNAYAYARTKAAVVLEEKNMTPHLLVSEILRIMGDAGLQEEMRQQSATFAPRDAATRIADILIHIGIQHT